MATFKKCNQEVIDLANEILCEFETHEPILKFRVRIDLLFAFGNRDENGNITGPAITHGGVKALGLAKIIGVKDRVAGRGDGEVLLDGDWWGQAGLKQRRALLDHELHHFEVKTKGGLPVTDDHGRPCLKCRKHDYEFGWFNVIAQRHGAFSIEVEQSTRIMREQGEFYFPKLVTKVT